MKDEQQQMKCCKCSHEWLDKPGAYGKHYGTGCPICGSLYWTVRSHGNAKSLAS